MVQSSSLKMILDQIVQTVRNTEVFGLSGKTGSNYLRYTIMLTWIQASPWLVQG